MLGSDRFSLFLSGAALAWASAMPPVWRANSPDRAAMSDRRWFGPGNEASPSASRWARRWCKLGRLRAAAAPTINRTAIPLQAARTALPREGAPSSKLCWRKHRTWRSSPPSRIGWRICCASNRVESLDDRFREARSASLEQHARHIHCPQ